MLNTSVESARQIARHLNKTSLVTPRNFLQCAWNFSDHFKDLFHLKPQIQVEVQRNTVDFPLPTVPSEGWSPLFLKGDDPMSQPSSHNRILNKFTSFSSLRWDHAGMHGLYCHPGIPRGIESQLPTALISSLIHSLLDTFLSLFYFSTLLTTFPRIISQISSLRSNPFWGLHLEETNINNHGNPSSERTSLKTQIPKARLGKVQERNHSLILKTFNEGNFRISMTKDPSGPSPSPFWDFIVII